MIIAEKGGSGRLFPHPALLAFALYANVVSGCCVLCVRMTDLDREHSRGGWKEGERTGGLDPLPPRKVNGVGQSQGWLTPPGCGQPVPGERGWLCKYLSAHKMGCGLCRQPSEMQPRWKVPSGVRSKCILTQHKKDEGRQNGTNRKLFYLTFLGLSVHFCGHFRSRNTYSA